MSKQDALLNRLNDWSPQLFLISGAIMILFAVHTTLTTYAGISYRPVQEFIVPGGFFLGVVGLIGLYPVFAERSRSLALLAALVAIVPAVCWALLTLGGIGEVSGILPEGGVLPTAIRFVVFAGMIASFTLFGLLTLYTGSLPSIVGILMLVEASSYILLIARLVPFFVVDILHVVAILGIGIVLWTGGSDLNPYGSVESAT